MSGTRMPQAVRAASSASDACRLHSSIRDFPERTTSDRPVRRFQRQEQIPAGGPRPRLLDVFQDGIAYFTLQRILLCASAFRVVHRERLRSASRSRSTADAISPRCAIRKPPEGTRRLWHVARPRCSPLTLSAAAERPSILVLRVILLAHIFWAR